MQSKHPHAKTCGAKTRSGKPCQNAPMANGRCRMHGGATPKGVASPAFKTGRYSRYLPERLMERYQDALHDEDLLNLRHEVALVDTRIADLLEQVERGDLGARWLELQAHYETLTLATQQKDLGAGAAAFEKIGALITGGASDYLVWAQISAMLEQRRRLAESERRRLVDMQQMITSEQAMTLVAALSDIVRKRVTDRDILAAIQNDLARLLDRRDARRDDTGDEDDGAILFAALEG